MRKKWNVNCIMKTRCMAGDAHTSSKKNGKNVRKEIREQQLKNCRRINDLISKEFFFRVFPSRPSCCWNVKLFVEHRRRCGFFIMDIIYASKEKKEDWRKKINTRQNVDDERRNLHNFMMEKWKSWKFSASLWNFEWILSIFATLNYTSHHLKIIRQYDNFEFFHWNLKFSNAKAKRKNFNFN